MKTGYILMDFDLIFPVQLSEFIISVTFGRNLKKNCIKKRENFIFHLKIYFYGWKNIFLIYKKVYSDRYELDLFDAIIIIESFHFSRKLWWKNWWKLPKLLRCGKVHSFQLSKILIPNFNSTNGRLERKLC